MGRHARGGCYVRYTHACMGPSARRQVFVMGQWPQGSTEHPNGKLCFPAVNATPTHLLLLSPKALSPATRARPARWHGMHVNTRVRLRLALQVHRFLGLNVGLIQSDLKPEARRVAYQCDITYVTNSELGFDYLRDNLAAVRACACSDCTRTRSGRGCRRQPAGLRARARH